MKKIITIYILLTCGIGYGQNLVPNGDFEQFSGCPTNWGQIDSALFWMNPTIVGAGGGSPDYFNSCATSFLVNVPSNPIGFQIPHSGNAYGGILLYHLFVGSNIREFIEVPLVSPLIANQQYHFEMYANISDDGAASTDAIAVYFSDTVISGVNNALPLPFNPQINNISGNFLDSLNWTLVSGDYTALGGESYLIIGNFKDDSLTTTIPNNTPENGSAPVAYALIDDVSLTLITGTNSSNEINIFETCSQFRRGQLSSVHEARHRAIGPMKRAKDKYVHGGRIDRSKQRNVGANGGSARFTLAERHEQSGDDKVAQLEQRCRNESRRRARG